MTVKDFISIDIGLIFKICYLQTGMKHLSFIRAITISLLKQLNNTNSFINELRERIRIAHSKGILKNKRNFN